MKSLNIRRKREKAKVHQRVGPNKLQKGAERPGRGGRGVEGVSSLKGGHDKSHKQELHQMEEYSIMEAQKGIRKLWDSGSSEPKRGTEQVAPGGGKETPGGN